MDKKQQIEKWLDQGRGMKEIASYLDVSRQRVYQIMAKYGIQTKERKKSGYWTQQPLERRTIWRILNNYFPRVPARMEALNKITIPTHCPVLGIELDYLSEGRSNASPSLLFLGSEIQVISWRAHVLMKGTADEHEAIARYISTSRQNSTGQVE